MEKAKNILPVYTFYPEYITNLFHIAEALARFKRADPRQQSIPQAAILRTGNVQLSPRGVMAADALKCNIRN